MQCVAVFLGLALFVAVQSTDFRRLKRTPQGIQISDWNDYNGKWYLYAVKHSCSWSGGAEFTDWVHTHVMDTSNYPQFAVLDKWRTDGSCSNTKAIGTPTSQGCYKIEDQVGDLWSGKVVIVDADKRLKRYALRWGCVKYLGDVCADYFVSLKTRSPNPDRRILEKVNRKLTELWDMSLSELTRVPHNEPCDPSAAPPPSGRSLYRKY